ncbi:uncharacterized protein DS421_6g193180 [Arachis hypogaea]|nr:uncharacterized protein DS421_6g193180 [Arachis hypogaea]
MQLGQKTFSESSLTLISYEVTQIRRFSKKLQTISRFICDSCCFYRVPSSLLPQDFYFIQRDKYCI